VPDWTSNPTILVSRFTGVVRGPTGRIGVDTGRANHDLNDDGWRVAFMYTQPVSTTGLNVADRN
jgi:hypothetical protein